MQLAGLIAFTSLSLTAALGMLLLLIGDCQRRRPLPDPHRQPFGDVPAWRSSAEEDDCR